MVLSKADGSGVETSGWINGTEVADLNSTGKLIGTYTITAAWADVDNETDGLQEPAADIKAALTNKSFTATLSAKGNVVLLSSNERSDNTNEVSGNVTVTVTWNGSAFSISCDKSAFTTATGTVTGYFAVQTNHDGGQEYIHSDEVGTDKLFAAGTPVNPYLNGENPDALADYDLYHSHDSIDLQ